MVEVVIFPKAVQGKDSADTVADIDVIQRSTIICAVFQQRLVPTQVMLQL